MKLSSRQKKKPAKNTRIYIDQSGKVETSTTTVIAFSNGKSGNVLIKPAEKRKIQATFRKSGKPLMYAYQTFAALIYLLIKDLNLKSLELHIDREYIGKEPIIKDHLLRIIRKEKKINFDPSKITFLLVGKKNNCHILAISVLRKRLKADKILTATDVLRLII